MSDAIEIMELLLKAQTNDEESADDDDPQVEAPFELNGL